MKQKRLAVDKENPSFRWATSSSDRVQGVVCLHSITYSLRLVILYTLFSSLSLSTLSLSLSPNTHTHTNSLSLSHTHTHTHTHTHCSLSLSVWKGICQSKILWMFLWFYCKSVKTQATYTRGEARSTIEFTPETSQKGCIEENYCNNENCVIVSLLSVLLVSTFP